MLRRGLGTEIPHHFFVPPPPLSEKRRTKSAKPQEKRQEELGISFMKTGGAGFVLRGNSYPLGRN